jgi:TonB family protein
VLSILLAAGYSLPGQSPKDYYQEFVGPDEKLLSADHQNIYVKTASGQYVQKIFYPEKKVMTHLITFSDKKFRIRDGVYREWYDNGRPWKEGAFQNNLAEGIWQFYSFDDGSRTSQGPMQNGKPEGQWSYFNKEGILQYEQYFQDGRLHGQYRAFDLNGQVTTLRTYENGELTAEQFFRDGAPVDSIKLQEVFPYLAECEQEDPEVQKACSQQKFLETIYKEIKYPRKARELGIQGEAVFRFVIEKDGALAQAVALRGVCAEMETECLRVIDLLPAWNPGRQNGRAVRVQFNLPIRFRLE